MKKLLYLLFLLPSLAFSQLSISPTPNNGEIVLGSNSVTLYFANPTSNPISMSLSMSQPGFSFGINRCSGKTLSKGQSCYAIISVNEQQLSSGINLAVVNNNSSPVVSLSRTKTAINESSIYTQSIFSFSDFLTQDLIIQNKTQSVKSYNPQLSGSDSSKFEITINRCSNVPINGTCRISLRLKPQQAGTYSASLSEPQVTGSVSLSGIITGSTQGVVTPPTESFSVSSNSIDFGTLSSFSTTSSRVLSITNTGNVVLAPKIETTSKVKVILNRCSSLPVGGSCSITLALSPINDMSNGPISDQSISIKKSQTDLSSVSVALVANLNILASCPINQHLEGQACVSNTRSCSVANGSGSQNWMGHLGQAVKIYLA